MDLEIELDDGCALALDRRTYDADGRLTITECVISAAQVNPYLGSEIPDFEQLGLDPNRVYSLYRDPAALRAAVPLFDGQPLLIDHVAVSAADPKQQMIVGTVGDCLYRDGKVVGTVSVWDAEAIRGIESNVRRDLSCGYRYVPDMRPGRAPNGDEFDGRMLDITPNHIAIVSQGRVSGAMVGDAALRRRRVGRALTVDTATALRLAAEQGREHSAFERAIPGYNRLR